MPANNIRVVPEHLFASSAHVETHAAELNESHAAASVAIDDSMPLLPPLAAAAMAEKAADWQLTTAIFTERLTQHSQNFANAAWGFTSTDEGNAEQIGSLGMSSSPSGLRVT